VKVSRPVLKPSQNGDISGLGQPTTAQQTKLAKLFGCCRVVWNDALAHCIELYKAGEKKLSNSQLQKKFITQAKKMVEREWLRIGL